MPRSDSQDYADWLPNASARFVITPELQLRLSYTHTRSRPNFGDYNPGFFFGPPSRVVGPNDPPLTFDELQFAAGGNPNLKPLKSKNFDASLEYYFSRTGAISAAVFRRDLDGFIQRQLRRITTLVPGLTPNSPPILKDVKADLPFNTGKGRIDGFEIQTTTFLDFGGLPEWASAFGVQANVTYIDAKTGFIPNNSTAPVTLTPIVGVSKWTYNLAAFYEKNGLSARISYNYRGAFTGRSEPRGPNEFYSEKVNGISRLDFSTNYAVTDNITLTAEAINILAKPLKSTLTYGFDQGRDPISFPRAVRYEESVFTLGLRFKL